MVEIYMSVSARTYSGRCKKASMGAMLDNIYNASPTSGTTRYSPTECCGTRKLKVKGNPDVAQVSTSFVERQNLTMRMSMRRTYDAADQWIQQEDRKPSSCSRA